MNEQEKDSTAQHRIRIADTSAAPRIYSNNAQITASQFDFTIFFGEMIQQLGSDSAEIEVAPRAVIVMSPEHAKALLKALDSTVAQWTQHQLSNPGGETKD